MNKELGFNNCQVKQRHNEEGLRKKRKSSKELCECGEVAIKNSVFCEKCQQKIIERNSQLVDAKFIACKAEVAHELVSDKKKVNLESKKAK